ncbi:phage tail assembly chaperone [Pararhizobium sp. DWP1-1-3]|uniref:phage tail assembly chaperone n=1 Tax=Pararhizobium sp. DWP1-1-3 TaxID=2804652 RepID=UPI003CF2B20D
MRDQHQGKKPRIPIAGQHVWHWFKKMDVTREGTGYGINPLQPTQIEAWTRQRGIKLTPWQLDAIEALDVLRLQLFFEKSSGDKDTEVVISDRPLSPALFDAIFPK